jgi:hypothetical protein
MCNQLIVIGRQGRLGSKLDVFSLKFEGRQTLQISNFKLKRDPSV